MSARAVAPCSSHCRGIAASIVPMAMFPARRSRRAEKATAAKRTMADDEREKSERTLQKTPGWLDAFAALSGLDPSSRAALSALPEMKFAKGRCLFGPGVHCAGFVLLLSGRIRVGLTAENGRRLVLYRVVPGETCVQTTLCLLGGLDYTAEGVAESEL